MKQKRVPLRKCLGCGEMLPKQTLLRVVRAPQVKDEEGIVLQQGQLSIDVTGKKPGRGAYLCKSQECFALAKKARRLERAFACKIPEELYAQLQEELNALGD